MARSERREPVEKLWRRYEKGEATATDVIKRLRGQGTYLDSVEGEINVETFRSIISTITASKYLIRMMRDSGKYNSLDEKETTDFDDVAMQIIFGYKAITESEEYGKAQAEMSNMFEDFIGDETAIQPTDAPVAESAAPSDSKSESRQVPSEPGKRVKPRKKGLFARLMDIEVD